jgi:hypothetical protein
VQKHLTVIKAHLKLSIVSKIARNFVISLSEVLHVTEIVESGMKLVPVEYTVAYLLKARTVEAEKQPLLGNGLYTCSRGTHHIHCDVM